MLVTGESWASSAATRKSMQANRSRDTKPELALRRVLHAMGLRYRLCARPLPDVRRTADIVFRPARVAVEVRGCFWHGCPEHYRRPKANEDYWSAKVARNVARDADTERRLDAAGWVLVVVWEHDDPRDAAVEIATVILQRRSRSGEDPRTGSCARADGTVAAESVEEPLRGSHAQAGAARLGLGDRRLAAAEPTGQFLLRPEFGFKRAQSSRRGGGRGRRG